MFRNLYAHIFEGKATMDLRKSQGLHWVGLEGGKGNGEGNIIIISKIKNYNQTLFKIIIWKCLQGQRKGGVRRWRVRRYGREYSQNTIYNSLVSFRAPSCPPNLLHPDCALPPRSDPMLLLTPSIKGFKESFTHLLLFLRHLPDSISDNHF